VAIDLIPIPVKPDLPPWPDDPDQQKEWMQDFTKRFNDLYGILRQDVNRLATPVRAPVVDDSPDIGYAVARSTLNDTVLVLGMNRVQVGLQLANGADRGKVSITFKYLGVGPLVLGSGASTTYTADLSVAGVNGLDTGAEAGDTWYYVYVISGDHGPDVTDQTANNEQPPLRRHAAPVATLLSISATPLLPGGYNRYRRVGMVRNNGSSDLFRFTNAVDDEWFWWNEDISTGNFQVLSVTTSVITYTDVSCAAVAPPVSRDIEVHVQAADTAGQRALWIKNKDHGNVAASNNTTAVFYGSADTVGASPSRVGCDASQVIQYRTGATTTDAEICVRAYRDIR